MAGNKQETIKKARIIIINDFEKGIIWNSLDNRSGVFQKEPSYCWPDMGMNKSYKKKLVETSGHYLILDYDKKEEGGPYDQGGWCGWYTLLKTEDDKYLNLTGFNYLRFFIKKTGDEDFTIGLADKKWDLIGDSVKIEGPIEDFIVKRYKTGWIEIKIPFSEFSGLDFSRMAAFAIIFLPSRGKLFIDNLIVGFDPALGTVDEE